VGAISSLTGFMMADVLHLRTLSIFGSLCGISYNITRKPPQYNACAWGGIFMSVNLFMIYKLLQERNEIKFSSNDMELWEAHFEEHKCSPQKFFKVASAGTWKTTLAGASMVEEGCKLGSVMLISKGKAGVFKNEQKIYELQGGKQGCIVGGSALLDKSVRDNLYPQSVICIEDTTYIEWEIHTLRDILDADRELESTFLHLFSADMFQALKHTNEDIDRMAHNKQAYKDLLEMVIADGFVHPNEKRMLRRFREEHNISTLEHEQDLTELGWSVQEFVDSEKHPKKPAEIKELKRGRSEPEKRHMELYFDLLKLSVVDEITNRRERKILAKYAQVHSISTADHEALLRALGWTQEEFEAGRKQESSTVHPKKMACLDISDAIDIEIE